MKDAYYFSHDSNARNDEKILMLRSEYGWEGYGIYWVLVEMMFESSETGLYHSKIKGIAAGHSIDITLLENVINTCITENLFVSDKVMFWSESLRRRKEKYLTIKQKKSEAGKKGMAKRWGTDNTDITELKDSNNIDITEYNKGKERKGNKVKENKVNKNKYGEFEKVKLAKEEHSKLISRLGEIKTRDLIDRLDNYKESTGKTYKSDYATILNWHRREAKDEPGANKADGGTKKEGEDIAKRAGVLSL